MKLTIFPLLVSLAFGTLLSACGGGGGGGGGGSTSTPPAPSVIDSGAVYVFAPDAAGLWSQQAYIKPSNPGFDDGFGLFVALSGDTLAVSEYFEDSAATGIDGNQDNNSAHNSGAVHIFTRDAAGVWSQQAYIKASNTDAGDEFGGSIALSGDTLAVSAIQEDSAATGIDGDQSNNSRNL